MAEESQIFVLSGSKKTVLLSLFHGNTHSSLSLAFDLAGNLNTTVDNLFINNK